MKNLTIKRQENKTVETKVSYTLPAFFKKDSEVFGVYSEDKTVSIQLLDAIGVVRMQVRETNTFEYELARSIEITQTEFIEVYEKSIAIIEEASSLTYGRLRYDELKDRESEMRDVEMEMNEAREFEC